MRTIIITICLTISCFTVFAQIESFEYLVYFDVDKFNLSNQERDKLSTYCEDKIPTDCTILLSGHTDSDGDEEYNLELSRKRVLEVRGWLISNGYDPNKITIDFKGEKELYKDENTVLDKQLNRRVTINYTLISEKEENQPPKQTIKDLYKLLETEKQVFCINPNRDTILIMKNGTIISIPALTFRTSSRSCVSLFAKEILNYSDMILENLTTTSNGEQLETGGMLYLEAKLSNGNPIKIAKGKSIQVMLPTDSINNSMQLFNGARDAHDVMNWISDPNQMSFMRGKSGSGLDCGDCKFVFCRIRRMGKVIKGMFVKRQRELNKAYRRCLKNRERTSYGLDWFIYDDSLRQIELDRTREKMENGNVNFRDVSFYAFNISNLGWINCDAFSNFPEDKKVNMIVQEKNDPSKDVKIVFKKLRSIIPSYPSDSFYEVYRIPKGEPIYVVGLKYVNSKIYLAVKDTLVDNVIVDLEYKEVTVEELKLELEKLNQ